MKILLLNLPVNINDPSDFDTLRAPYGLAMISAVLKRDNWDVDLVDAQALKIGKEELVNLIKKTQPDMIGMTSFTFQLADLVSFADLTKTYLPDTKIILGGPHVSAEPDSTLKNHNNIDYIVIGEGENIMTRLVSCLNNGESIEQIEGLAFRKDGNIVVNANPQLVKDLDSLPYADWDSLPMDKYWDSLTVSKKYGMLIATRGCPYSCTFCAASVTQGYAIRKRSPGHFVGELKLLNEKFGIKEFNFCDSTFNFDNKYVVDVCNEIQRLNLSIKWRCTVRADRLDRETIRVMKKSGCLGVLMGIESADPAVLKLMKKGETIDKIKAGVKLLKEEKMPCDASFVLGLPGDTSATIDMTIQLAKEVSQVPKNLVGFTLASPFPGTELYKQAKKEGLSIQDWSRLDKYQISYVPKSMSKIELEQCYKKAIREIYLDPLFLIRRFLNIRSFTQLAINFRYGLRVIMRGLKVQKQLIFSDKSTSQVKC